jgi:hypothetical protein
MTLPGVFDLEILSMRSIGDVSWDGGDDFGIVSGNTYGTASASGFVLATSVDARPGSGGNYAASLVPPVLHPAKLLKPGGRNAFGFGYGVEQYLSHSLGLPFFDCGHGNARRIGKSASALIPARESEALFLPSISLSTGAEAAMAASRGGASLPQDLDFSSTVAQLVRQALAQVDPYLALRESWRRYIAEFDPGLADRWPNLPTASERDRLALIKKIMLAEREFSATRDAAAAANFLRGQIGIDMRAQRIDEIERMQVLQKPSDPPEKADRQAGAPSILASGPTLTAQIERISRALQTTVLGNYVGATPAGVPLATSRTVVIEGQPHSAVSMPELRQQTRKLYTERFAPFGKNNREEGCRVLGSVDRELDVGWTADPTFFRGRCEGGLAEGPGVAESSREGILSSRDEGLYKAGRPIGLNVGWVSYYLRSGGKPGERQRSVRASCADLLHVGGAGASWHPEGSTYSVHRDVSPDKGEGFRWEITFDKSVSPLEREKAAQILEQEKPRLLDALSQWKADRRRLIMVEPDAPSSIPGSMLPPSGPAAGAGALVAVTPPPPRGQQPISVSSTIQQGARALPMTTEEDMAPGRFAAQVGAFRIRDSAYSVRDQVAGELASVPGLTERERTTRVVRRGSLYHVLVGDFASASEAKAMAARISAAISHDVIVFRR